MNITPSSNVVRVTVDVSTNDISSIICGFGILVSENIILTFPIKESTKNKVFVSYIDQNSQIQDHIEYVAHVLFKYDEYRLLTIDYDDPWNKVLPHIKYDDSCDKITTDR